jgi:hypothetical protein
MSVRRAGCTPVLLPKAHTATKLTMQVRIPPSAPQASHFTGRGVRGTPRAHEGDPLPRHRTGLRRPLPLYGTFSMEDRVLAVAKEAKRHTAKVADGAATGKTLCGRLPGSAFSTPSCRNECLPERLPMYRLACTLAAKRLAT